MLISDALDRKEARIDLRRGVRRDLAETIVERAALLPPEDRRLVEAVFRDGLRLSEITPRILPALDAPRDPALRTRHLRRRLHKLIERLSAPRYAFVAEHLPRWGHVRRRVATACVLHGLSQREAAERLGLSLHAVRRHHQLILAVSDMATKGGPR